MRYLIDFLETASEHWASKAHMMVTTSTCARADKRTCGNIYRVMPVVDHRLRSPRSPCLCPTQSLEWPYKVVGGLSRGSTHWLGGGDVWDSSAQTITSLPKVPIAFVGTPNLIDPYY
jgi:hypothetical protein